MKRCLKKTGTGLLLLVSSLGSASAQSNWPTAPIRMVVSFAPGGQTDVVMRAVANELGGRLGRAVVIENKPGASGLIAAQSCVRGRPDGQTFCVFTYGMLSYVPVLMANSASSYDPATDILPVTEPITTPTAIFASAKLGVNDLREFIDYAKAHPGQINYGSTGFNSLPYLVMEYLKKAAGLDMTHIPYTGASPAMVALKTGEISILQIGLGAPGLQEELKAGHIKLLAVQGEKRLEEFPEVKTTHEFGYGGADIGVSWGLVAPRGTPMDIAERMRKEIMGVISDPEFQKRYLAPIFVKPGRGMPPKEYARTLERERAQTIEILKSIGALKPN